jgi:hypothetical protein
MYKLSKALYGLKQAPRAWYERLRDFLLSKGLKIGKVDTTLFTKKIENDIFICQIYIDDIIFGSTNEDFCKEFREMMFREFEMSTIGKLSFFLGLQIKQLKEDTFVCQSKYVKDILKKFGMEDPKPIKTPMTTNGHLDLGKGGKPVDLKLYRSMIGSLLYLTASRPDIMFSVCMCARFQAAPKECHLTVVKRIMRYLNILLTLVFGIRRVPNLNWLVIRTPIMQVARLIEKVHPVVFNFLDVLLYLGHQRSKILWLFPRPKRNISRR